jgi:hypothetical protein
MRTEAVFGIVAGVVGRREETEIEGEVRAGRKTLL